MVSLVYLSVWTLPFVPLAAAAACAPHCREAEYVYGDASCEPRLLLEQLSEPAHTRACQVEPWEDYVAS